ncbi:rRNA maturation RNase YbeY [Candidatus Collierbacteria bacterium RIFOXYD1_FULL_40_9]|uniref:Endoribonuclease YbeY n=1 Tax=Candidatus Collierbacteria bacterium RIFOXYD1_FULL_40_9 TaxID=1817731 RepID=A0A1F5FUZ0_9BACT|nr:MAG: rRNA maturation RNase YbeY [Candidatus Collierbacteria bacterium RIFOXYD1_FULL_40_9]
MMKLNLEITADSRYAFDRKRVKLALEKVLLEQNKFEGKVNISLSVVGERKIRELEQKFFGRDEVTDVLSFPQDEGEQMPDGFEGHALGDIVVCYPQAKRQAMQWNRLIDEEIEFLACHGLLHLLGIHHD